jgi:type IV pilus assembly protein PilB
VNRILNGAIADGASDIHLEPHPDELKVRLRIDGALADYTPVPKTSAIPLVSRIKILCKMDIAEKRVPQDGAMQVNFRGRQIDLRVSTVPTIWGEKVVMRVLNKEAVSLELASLGFTERQQEYFRHAADASHGLIYVTGPTGSGKSTTLYATLTLLKSPTKNLLTVEDPVEYKLPGINQTQVKAGVGLDFARVLRAFLRQDPDVIMVGEVRDAETAQICLRAALTGHLVLSTLHTNDALSTVSRLTDLGLEPFMLAASLRLIEAQRLVRRLCVHCKDPFMPNEEIQHTYGIPAGMTIFRPKGCENCRKTGYRGRIGIFEVVPINPPLANLIQDRVSVNELKKEGKKQGIMFLKDHGIERAKQGITSLEEVNRVTLVEE